MINLIKEYLLKLVDNIDAGNSNLTEDETIKLISVLKELTDRERRLSKYESCRYLNVSRATFDNYVRAGKLPRDEHNCSELFKSWFGEDIDQKVIEAAILYWFKDNDCKSNSKLWNHFKEN